MLDFDKIINIPTPIVEIFDNSFSAKGLQVFVKRDDLTHSLISGNKFRKLKYNLIEAKSKGKSTLLTFGGAYSNHILAVAASAKMFGFKSKGIIRGDELNSDSSITLKNASDLGMQLEFVSRAKYRNKNEFVIAEVEYLIPEGGSNNLALLGISEMVDEIVGFQDFDYICCAVGTGGTVAGICSNKNFKGKVLGIPVLKSAEFLMNDISVLLDDNLPANLKLAFEYHFGGYGKWNNELLDFMYKSESKFGFQLDQIYTAKLFYAVFDLIDKNYFPAKSKICLLHTGGIQGRISTKHP